MERPTAPPTAAAPPPLFGRERELARLEAALADPSVRLLTGTPELLATVAPVLGLGTLYCAIYSAGLGRMRAGTG